jgi:hypothetical protein
MTGQDGTPAALPAAGLAAPATGFPPVGNRSAAFSDYDRAVWAWICSWPCWSRVRWQIVRPVAVAVLFVVACLVAKNVRESWAAGEPTAVGFVRPVHGFGPPVNGLDWQLDNCKVVQSRTPEGWDCFTVHFAATTVFNMTQPEAERQAREIYAAILPLVEKLRDLPSGPVLRIRVDLDPESSFVGAYASIDTGRPLSVLDHPTQVPVRTGMGLNPWHAIVWEAPHGR